MNYEIMYGNAFPVVKCVLQYGESIKAESDAMICMSNTLDVEGSMDLRDVLPGQCHLFYLSQCGQYGLSGPRVS